MSNDCKQLIKLMYLDYFSNFASIEGFAKYYNLSIVEARLLTKMAQLLKGEYYDH